MGSVGDASAVEGSVVGFGWFGPVPAPPASIIEQTRSNDGLTERGLQSRTHRLSETDPTTGNAQRDGDDEPDGNDQEHGREWHRAARSFRPQEEVEDEEGAKDRAGDQKRGEDDVLLPRLAANGLVDPCRYISTHEAEDRVE